MDRVCCTKVLALIASNTEKSFFSSYFQPEQGTYKDDMRCGEGVYSYHGGRQDVGIWKGQKLIRLKFVISEIIPSHKSRSLPTPDMHSRGKHGPKGYLEVRKQADLKLTII